MTGVELWLLASLLALIAGASILGAAEAALLRVPRVRIKVAAEGGDKRSLMMVELLHDLPRVLNTVLLVVLLVQISAATVAGVLSSRVFGSLGVTLASFMLTFVLFVYSEAIPKTYAVRHPEAVARATAPLVRFLSWLLRPAVSLLVRFADLQAPGTGIASLTALTEAELILLATEAADVGMIDESDRILIDRAFEIGDQRVDDVYIPRLDVVAISNTVNIRDALEMAIRSGHRRLPIYNGDIDDIVGVVHLRGLAAASLVTPDSPVSSISVEPLVVPESRRVVETLDDMQQAGIHFAVVIDEYGGTAGIVTIEDIVARLVGPISVREGASSNGIERVDESTWLVVGTTDLDDLEREIEFPLPHGDWNTVAGLVIGHAGHIPATGDEFDIAHVTFKVVATTKNRITRISVRTTSARQEPEKD